VTSRLLLGGDTESISKKGYGGDDLGPPCLSVAGACLVRDQTNRAIRIWDSVSLSCPPAIQPANQSIAPPASQPCRSRNLLAAQPQ